MDVKVSVIIPVLNCWALTQSCLLALAGVASGLPAGAIEVLVVDNASTDATPQECATLGEALFPGRFSYLRQPVNRNFAPACNLGARAACSEYLFFLNNDTRVTPGWLAPLLKAFTGQGKLGACGPTLLYPEFSGFADRVQHVGICFEPQFYPVHIFEAFPASHPAVARSRRYQAVTAAALLTPRKLFMDIGLFDEDFINGGEDIELGIRLGRLGFASAHVPEAVVYHLCGQTQGRHAHEEHNGAMLKQKALPHIVPDMHLAAREQGYTLELSLFARPFLALPERRLGLLRRHVPDPRDEAALENFLLKEPLWFDGYAQLAALRAEKGNLQGAADALGLSFKLRPEIDTAGAIALLAAKGARAVNANDAQSMLQAAQNGINFDALHEKASGLRNFWDKVEEGEAPPGLSVRDLYAKWLDKEAGYRSKY